MKHRLMVFFVLCLLLISMLSLPPITSLSAAELSGNSLGNQGPTNAANPEASPTKTSSQDESKNLYDNWQDIFRNNLSSGSQHDWDFNNTNTWLSSAYVDGNKTRIVVGLSNNRIATVAQVANIATKHGGEIVDTVSFKMTIDAVVVELPLTSVTSFVGEIRGAKLASYVEPNMKMQAQLVPNDPFWNLQWGPQKVQADWAWNTTTGDSSILVAVVDTGIDYSHPELSGSYVPLGYDWVNLDNDPIDDFGHGTHCAGIIAAAINNGVGIAGLAQVRIMAEKVLDSYGGGYEDWVANGIIHAVDQGAKIISMSLGGSGDSELIHDAVKYAYSAGVLVIASAGNSDTNLKMYPAAYDEVIAVAATDQNDFKASFSNWGDWIELAAPGVDIYSTMPTYPVTMNTMYGLSMNYDYMSGTSMACPHVVGVAALLWSHYPNKTGDWIRQWLHYTADDLGDHGFDVYYGYGRVNARNAVEQVPPAHELIMSGWITPPYVEPGTTGIVNVSVLNFGEQDETNVQIQLIANDSVTNTAVIDSIMSGGVATATLTWNPTVEGSYNITAYIVPVPGETSIANNVLSKNIVVGTPLKAVVLRSYGNYESRSITSWMTLNDQWQLFGDRMIYIDYTTLNKVDITYADIADTNADVLIISCAASEQFIDSEISAITTYVHEGHGLIATAGTFYQGVPNNNKLLPLFGMNQLVPYYSTGTDLLHLLDLGNPLFDNVPNPMVFPEVGSAVPTYGQWDSRELTDGHYSAMGHFNESAIVTYRGLVYISPWLEIIPPYYYHPLKLLYNAILWSNYQKPQHELAVSLEAPSHLAPGESTLLNATVSNMGLSDESNVELDLIVDDTTVSSTIIPQLLSTSSYTMQFLWSPTNQKAYNVTAYAPPVSGEESAADNVQTVFVSVRQASHILFDQTHNTFFMGYFSNWLTNVTSRGDMVDILSFGPITPDVLEGYDVFIIPEAYYPYSNDELLAIQDYVYSGGGLLVIGDDIPSIYTSLTSFSGISWMAGGNSGLTMDITPHPVTSGVSTVYLAGPVAYMLVNGDAQGLVRDSGSNIMLAVSEQQNGRVIGFADEDSVGNYGINSADNMRLALNMIDWLSIHVPNEHDLRVSVNAPAFLEPNSSFLLNATVKNVGIENETNVEVQLYIQGTLTASALVNDLPSGSLYTLSYLWNPTLEGTYNVTAYSPPVQNETHVGNNVASATVTVMEPLINPAEGQYANYSIYVDDPIGGITFVGGWNFTYANYVSPWQINVTMFQWTQTSTVNVISGQTSWVVVNVFNRLCDDDSGIYWRGLWYPGWIETNVGLGSGIGLLNFNATVTGSKLVLVGNRLIDCWEMQISDSGMSYDFFYDKASGLWVAMDVAYGTQIEHLMLLDTNVQIGYSYPHELAVTLNADSTTTPGENTIISAAVYNLGLNDETNVELQIIINGTAVDNATVGLLHAGENFVLNYTWTPLQMGQYNVTAYTPPVAGEQWTDNNVLSKLVTCFYDYTRIHNPHQWIGGGTAMNWHADDQSWQYTLPFGFPFYGIMYWTIYISSNGLITFNGPDNSWSNSISDLGTRLAIAPAWDDWVTNDPYDIYIWTNSTHVCITWHVRSYGGNITDGNFEALLCSDGTIQFDYSNFDGVASATLGISDGAGRIIAEDQTDLNNIETIIFRPSATNVIPGDINGDGKISLADLTLLGNAYGSIPGDPNWNPNADLAAPLGRIGLTDLVTLAIYYSQSAS